MWSWERAGSTGEQGLLVTSWEVLIVRGVWLLVEKLDLEYTTVCRKYGMERHIHIKQLLVYLKFKFNWASSFY